MKPKEIFLRLQQLVKKYDADGQANLFTEDAIWELPFAPEGTLTPPKLPV